MRAFSLGRRANSSPAAANRGKGRRCWDAARSTYDTDLAHSAGGIHWSMELFRGARVAKLSDRVWPTAAR